MLTSLLLYIPLVSCIIVLFTPGMYAKRFSFISSLLTFAIALYIYFQFQVNAEFQYIFDLDWIPSLGIRFKLGFDGISLLLVLLTTFLVPLILLSIRSRKEGRPRLYYSLILLMEMALIGVFLAMDGFLFYIFWELALIPIYFICLLWGGKNRVRITIKFFIYTLAGSLFMLVALLYLYLHTPAPHSFDIHALYMSGRSLDGSVQCILFWFFFLAFAIKMPLFPLHTWQPDTYTDAPSQGTMMLAGIMLKMGIYGVIRLMLPALPLGVSQNSWIVIWLAVIGIVYASCIAITRNDIKRLFAYSSIAHVGLIAAGIFAFNLQGLQGGMIQMLSHGVNIVGLFFVADIIQSRTNIRKISMLGGIRKQAPLFSTCFMIIMLGAVALPLTDGFVGEFLLINGLFQYRMLLAAIGGLTVILGAVYLFRTYQSTMLGETSAETQNFTDLTIAEKGVMIPLVLMVLIIGIFPDIFLKISEPAFRKLLSGI